MRYLATPSAAELDRMTTGEIRRDFLVRDLFRPGAIELAYSDLDRLVVGGIVPDRELRLQSGPELASGFFTERREIGVINLGDAGEVVAGANRFRLKHLDCLYIGLGEPDIVFRNEPGGQAVFYLLSAPAHQAWPTAIAMREEAAVQQIGSAGRASKRTLTQYIHEDGVQSCQLVMGFTTVAEGSVWNTWPPHTHWRRSEIYLYFDTGGEPVIHFLGEPGASKHVIVREREAVLSPPWSIHTGVGTMPYSFVWGMAGENRAFGDMDTVDLTRFG